MSSWFIRRANVVNSAGGRLPAEFTELAYIESTGTQYIDTGVKPTNKTRWELDVEFSTGTIPSTYWYNGVYNNGSSARRFDIALSPNIFINAGASTQVGPKEDAQGVRQTYVVDALNALWSYGNTSGTFSSVYSAAFAYSIYICARNDYVSSTRGANRFAVEKVYSSRLYENGTLIQDLVPAKRDSDNEVGMYDLVSGSFLTDGNGGSFGYGEL